MRDVARHAVQRKQCGIRVRATNVHVLAENGELLGQVAIERGQLVKTRFVVNAPLVPLLERVRAAAHNGNVELVSALDQRVAQLGQLLQYLSRRLAYTSGNLQHAGGHFRHHVAGDLVPGHQADHVFGVGRQVVVVRVDQLKFQLHAQRQGLGRSKGFKRHGSGPFVFPRRCRVPATTPARDASFRRCGAAPGW